jgi:serine-type D-Ala-D-Ala carboxypeptidase/endopeptidase (penicillin-binding protein 4)
MTRKVHRRGPGGSRPGRFGLLCGAALLAAGAAGCAPLAPPRPPEPSPLQRLAAVVDSIMATPPFQRTHWGIVLQDPDHDVPLFAVNAERNFVPASNMKLVTGAVALAELGEEYRYRTVVAATGVVAGDTVAGALVVHGSGDPTLSARFHDAPFAALDSLADSVAVRGIRHFRDGLVVDATRFTDGPVHFAWFLGNLPSRFAAGTAAFGIEEGTLLLVPRPGATVGASANVDVLPYDGVADLVTRLDTGPPGARPGLSVARRIPGDTLVIEGTVPAKTGTITHVNGLSGYIITEAGRELAFSILTNATGAPAGSVREAMDRIVRVMADVDPGGRER